MIKLQPHIRVNKWVEQAGCPTKGSSGNVVRIYLHTIEFECILLEVMMEANSGVNNPIAVKLLKPVDVAIALNISTSFAYRLMQCGDIPSGRIRGACRVRTQDLEEYIERNLHNLRSAQDNICFR